MQVIFFLIELSILFFLNNSFFSSRPISKESICGVYSPKAEETKEERTFFSQAQRRLEATDGHGKLVFSERTN